MQQCLMCSASPHNAMPARYQVTHVHIPICHTALLRRPYHCRCQLTDTVLLCRCAAKVTGLAGKPDCYTVIELGGARVARTRIDMDNNDPKWGERFVIACAHDVDDVIVRVKDKDAVGSKTMGLVRAAVEPAE